MEIRFGLILAILCLAYPLAAEGPIGLFESGNIEAAKKAFSERLAKDPEDPEALYYLGRLSLNAPKAKEYFTKLVQIHPEHPLADDAAFELAEAVFAGPNGLYLSARKRYQRFLSTYKTSPLVPQALYRIGLTHLAVGQPDSALGYFRETADQFPNSEISSFAKLAMVDAAAMSGKTEEAGRLAEELASEAPATLKSSMKERHTSLSISPSKLPTGKGFWVRVGAFGRVDNARNLAAALKGSGYQVRESTLAGGALMLLEVGPYLKREKAEQARIRIEKAHNLTCMVREQI